MAAIELGKAVGTLPPLVVDLDGTLTKSDTLFESTISMIRQNPTSMLMLPIWLFRGKAVLKREIASRTSINVASLPFCDDLVSYIRQEKAKGRRVVLATAAHRSIAERVAMHFGFFDDVLATDGEDNLKGEAKLRRIQATLGAHFVYAGDSVSDIPIWKEAQSAILVNCNSKVVRSVAGLRIEKQFHSRTQSARVWLSAFRVHQWLKNLLIFVPLFTSFSFYDIHTLCLSLLAFLSFSVVASATYIINDLWDLESDRAHPRKRRRAVASGDLSINRAIVASVSLMLVGSVAAVFVGPFFALSLFAYVCSTLIYSLVLKSYVLIDVVTLAMLYTLRIFAGSIAIGVTTSDWLFVFSVFLFFSLALVKRCAELISLQNSGQAHSNGRDYHTKDLDALLSLGTGSGLCAAIVFGLFVNSPETQQRYAAVPLLWAIIPLLIYWLSRLWVKTTRSEMHDDPIVYACKDQGSRVVVLAMVVIVLAARFLAVR